MPTQLVRHDEYGHVHFLTISCYHRLPFFRLPQTRDIVVRGMGEARDRLDFQWIGYVVMPEHVHWLILPETRNANELIPISKILLSLKTSIGRQVKAHLRDLWRERRTLGNRGLDTWATRKTETRPIWTTRGIDFNVTSIDKLREKLDYCHRNPITRGLVERPEDWIWSSYRYYDDDAGPLAMDWEASRVGA